MSSISAIEKWLAKNAAKEGADVVAPAMRSYGRKDIIERIRDIGREQLGQPKVSDHATKMYHQAIKDHDKDLSSLNFHVDRGQVDPQMLSDGRAMMKKLFLDEEK